jgi:hypothetical protein
MTRRLSSLVADDEPPLQNGHCVYKSTSWNPSETDEILTSWNPSETEEIVISTEPLLKLTQC